MTTPRAGRTTTPDLPAKGREPGVAGGKDYGMETKFTPGPWQFEPHNLYQSDFNGMDGEDFPLGYISTSPTPQPIFALHTILEFGFDTQTANARLIAAAPELLQVLQEAVEDLLMLSRAQWCEYEGSEDELVGRARAAIAKATGA